MLLGQHFLEVSLHAQSRARVGARVRSPRIVARAAESAHAFASTAAVAAELLPGKQLCSVIRAQVCDFSVCARVALNLHASDVSSALRVCSFAGTSEPAPRSAQSARSVMCVRVECENCQKPSFKGCG